MRGGKDFNREMDYDALFLELDVTWMLEWRWNSILMQVSDMDGSRASRVTTHHMNKL